jgi:hypothetical protein
MKTFKQFLSAVSICLSTTFAHAQVFNCSDFSILGYGNDPNIPGNSLIHIYVGGDSLDFISYPYITVVTDCNNDTIATGSMNFFGQIGQTVQSYSVTGDITSACLPISVEFVYGNTNFETDTCVLSLSGLPSPLLCDDFMPIDIQVDQSNTQINITMQGTENSYIFNPSISFVTDCEGDTIATGFINYSGQIGLSTQGYPITSTGNSVCYPVIVEFIYVNTNSETDTCFLTLENTNGAPELSIFESNLSIFPNPASNEVTIQTNKALQGKKYFIYDYHGKLILSGKLISENTFIEINKFSNGLYILKIDDHLGEKYNIIKQ